MLRHRVYRYHLFCYALKLGFFVLFKHQNKSFKTVFEKNWKK